MYNVGETLKFKEMMGNAIEDTILNRKNKGVFYKRYYDFIDKVEEDLRENEDNELYEIFKDTIIETLSYFEIMIYRGFLIGFKNQNAKGSFKKIKNLANEAFNIMFNEIGTYKPSNRMLDLQPHLSLEEIDQWDDMLCDLALIYAQRAVILGIWCAIDQEKQERKRLGGKGKTIEESLCMNIPSKDEGLKVV